MFLLPRDVDRDEDRIYDNSSPPSPPASPVLDASSSINGGFEAYSAGGEELLLVASSIGLPIPSESKSLDRAEKEFRRRSHRLTLFISGKDLILVFHAYSFMRLDLCQTEEQPFMKVSRR